MILHIQLTEHNTNRSIQLNESAQYNKPSQNDKSTDNIAKIEKSTQQQKKHTPKNTEIGPPNDKAMGTKETKTATRAATHSTKKKRKKSVLAYSGMKT